MAARTAGLQKQTTQQSALAVPTSAAKKEETIEERIRRIRSKNNPQDENQQRQGVQQMSSALGVQSAKAMPVLQARPQHALSLTGGHPASLARQADQSWISDQTNTSFVRNNQQ